MHNKELQERQAFFDEISNYQYIRQDGWLVLESFCVHLSNCFGFDGIPELSPKPRDVYMLLIDIIRERLGDEEAKKIIQLQNVVDWRPELIHIFPERQMTCIHLGALVMVSHDWIYDIGHILMGIPEPEEGRKYFAWVKEDWLAVYTFINGYHNAFVSFQKKHDIKMMRKSGYSLFEALHLAGAKDINFDEAVSQLKGRHDSYQAAMSQISKSLEDGYYLEAITLEECLISNCLFNFLDATGSKLFTPSFHTLLKEISDKQDSAYDYPCELLSELDKWRKARNIAIHGFISSTSMELDRSRVNFHQSAKATALMGEEYCKAVVSWYEVECVNFVRHEFPPEKKDTVH